MNDTEKFEWVKARHECSTGSMFEKLRLDVKADVETRQGLREKTEFGYINGFTFSSRSDRFSANAATSNSRQSVIFVLQGNDIAVTDENDQLVFRGKVTLSNDRVCRFVVDDQELEDWQFRKKALEGLFFGKK